MSIFGETSSAPKTVIRRRCAGVREWRMGVTA
jgi:hypothetical protein